MKKILLLFILTFSATIVGQKIKFGKVSKEALEEKFYPLDSTAEAAYLYKEKNISYTYSYDYGWRIITKVKERIKLYSKNDPDIITKKIRLFTSGSRTEKVSLIKAFVFNLKNNKIEKTKLNKKDVFKEVINKNWFSTNFTMPNAQDYSVIDLSYTITSPFPSHIDKIYLQDNYPIKESNLIVKIPEYFTNKYHVTGYLPLNLDKSSKQRKIPYRYTKMVNQINGYQSKKFSGVLEFNDIIYTINKKNTPKIAKNEPYILNLNKYKSAIKFEISGVKIPNTIYKSFSNTWEDVCKTVYNSSSFGGELNKDNYYKDEIINITTSTKNNTEKAIRIFQFIKSKIKWNGYYGKYVNKGVKKAYKEGVGNVAEINLALTSMLRSAGLNANPVLISTIKNGIPLFPTTDGFNYVISKVNLSNGQHILLDATEKYSSPNILPFRTLNWYGKEILENGILQDTNLIPSSLSKENDVLHIKINDTGSIQGMHRKSLTGHKAMYYRQKNNLKKKEDRITSLEERYNIEIDEFKILNKQSLGKPIIQSIKFTGDSHIEEINNKLYFSPLFFLAMTENPFKSKERNFPIDYGTSWQNKFTVSLSIPKQYSIESYPKEQAIRLPDNLGSFKYKIIVLGNKLKLTSITQLNSNSVSPEYYKVLQEFYKQLVEKQTEKIVLIKK
ncbi:transglutaminase domain-containing protein [Tenacibaculum aiptasiae]|uniref:DUF3857 domain-containing protein n=1 Tax=Tenacibaculum aiptasiae TaxID=426481 RepID=UPI003B59125E